MSHFLGGLAKKGPKLLLYHYNGPNLNKSIKAILVDELKGIVRGDLPLCWLQQKVMRVLLRSALL